MTNEWESGTEPWLRQTLRAEQPATCPFCGEQTLILSLSDIDRDNGRVEAYCDSQVCDAREITVLVTRDNTSQTAARADVAALAAIESGRYEAATGLSAKAQSLRDFMDDRSLRTEAILERRTTGTPVIDLRPNPGAEPVR